MDKDDAKLAKIAKKVLGCALEGKKYLGQPVTSEMRLSAQSIVSQTCWRQKKDGEGLGDAVRDLALLLLEAKRKAGLIPSEVKVISEKAND